jgi:hypothetical protein
MSKDDNWGVSEEDKLEKVRKQAIESVSRLYPCLLEEIWDWSKGILGFAFAIGVVGTIGVLVLALAKYMGVL